MLFVGLVANVIIVNQGGVNINFFLDSVVIMAMGIPICSVILVTGEVDFFGKAVKSLFSKKVELTKEEANNAVNLFVLVPILYASFIIMALLNPAIYVFQK